MQNKLAAARGEKPCDLVLKNAYVLNVFTDQIITADVGICQNTIVGVGEYYGIDTLDCTGKYLVPGMIDAHIHMESSMVLPHQLSATLLKEGTTTVIADPHEMVNVKGTQALDWMLATCMALPMDVYLTLPSSVPTTDSECNGAGDFDAAQMNSYLNHPRVVGLGEVLRTDDTCMGRPDMLKKLELFANLPIDGHAYQLNEPMIQAYRTAGVQTDHGFSSAQEAISLLQAGFSLFLQDGQTRSSIDNCLPQLLQSKLPLTHCMFCTDDKSITEIKKEGHINHCVRKAIELGVRPITAYKMASYFTAQHFGLHHLGAIAAGYQADILLLDNLEDANPQIVFKNGIIVSQAYFSAFPTPSIPQSLLQTVHIPRIQKSDLALPAMGYHDVIEAVPNQRLTNHLYEEIPVSNGEFLPSSIYNKLCVIERHGEHPSVAVAPLKGFGLGHGAIACSISHDSHNLIVVGDNDGDILAAIDHVRDLQGGIAVVSAGHLCGSLALPFCGLMSIRNDHHVEQELHTLYRYIYAMGIDPAIDPIATLSWLSLPVIPEIRLTAKGLFDVLEHKFI